MDLMVVFVLFGLIHVSIQTITHLPGITEYTIQKNREMQKAYAERECGKILDEESLPFLDYGVVEASMAKALAEYYSSSGRKKREVLTDSFRWQMPIKYFFKSGFSDADKLKVQDALQYIESETCVRFAEMSSDEIGVLTDSHVQFISSTSCVAFWGRSDLEIPQPLFVAPDCLQKQGYLVHEILQTVGLWHEHQRPDRDDYITVNIDIVEPNEDGSFIIVPNTHIDMFGLPYDYASIMHFRGDHLSSTGDNVITTKDPLHQSTIGQRAQISFLDSKLLNYAYCNDTCTGAMATVCVNDGYRDPNNCNQCKCPDGFAPPTCLNMASSDPASCGGQLTADLTEKYITLSGYSHNQQCNWMIQPLHDGQVQVRFVDSFGVYCDNSVCHHWVEIRNKKDLHKLGYRFCCSTTPSQTLTAEESNVMVLFRSMYTQTNGFNLAGFKLAYKVVGADACNYLTCGENQQCDSEQAKCVCTSGWTGDDCKTIVDPCNSKPCLNAGTCEISGSGFTCKCADGFTGNTCQNEVVTEPPSNDDTSCDTSCSPTAAGQVVLACGVKEVTSVETKNRTVVYFESCTSEASGRGWSRGRRSRRSRRYRQTRRCRKERIESYSVTVKSYEGEGHCCKNSNDKLTNKLFPMSARTCGASTDKPVCGAEGWSEWGECKRNYYGWHTGSCTHKQWRYEYKVWRNRMSINNYGEQACECAETDDDPHHEHYWWHH